VSEEEKEAIKNLEHIVKHWKPDNENDELANIEYNSIKVAVNLIDKLQKENKELKEDNQKQWEERCRLTFKLDDYISKDKIREKIKELEEDLIENYGELGESLTTNEIKTLKKLLEEE
jgi:hypothetical protein